jgi:hypothetical protein
MMMLALLAASLTAAATRAPARSENPVDLELALGIDVSRSIDVEEARLQREGYIAAFRHARVIEAIKSGMLGRIAVMYYEWGGFGYLKVIADWTLIEDQATAHAFADALTLAPLGTARRTTISAAIDFGVSVLDGNGFEGTRRVIDLSGDGPNNLGELVTRARDRAVAEGVTINGLPIMNDRPSFSGWPPLPNLDLYYRDCVIGGPRAFLVVASDFLDFARAVRRKLVLEIADLAPGDKERLHRSGRGLLGGRTPSNAITPGGRLRLAAVDGRVAPPCDAGERRWRDRMRDLGEF